MTTTRKPLSIARLAFGALLALPLAVAGAVAAPAAAPAQAASCTLTLNQINGSTIVGNCTGTSVTIRWTCEPHGVTPGVRTVELFGGRSIAVDTGCWLGVHSYTAVVR